MIPAPRVFSPPPYNGASTLIERRREIILAAIRAGQDYRTGLGYAQEAIPDEEIDAAWVKYESEKALYLDELNSGGDTPWGLILPSTIFMGLIVWMVYFAINQ